MKTAILFPYTCGVRPVVLDTQGRRYYGLNHKAAIASIPPGRHLDTLRGDAGHCFEVAATGAVIGRAEAARLTGLCCHIQAGRLHSEDLGACAALPVQDLPILYRPAARAGKAGFLTPDGQFLTPREVADREQARALGHLQVAEAAA